MEKWEYTSVIEVANINNNGAKEYLQKRWPNFQPDSYSAETLIPILNEFGEKGWELIYFEPVAIDDHGKVIKTSGVFHDTNLYLCVFKRRIE